MPPTLQVVIKNVHHFIYSCDLSCQCAKCARMFEQLSLGQICAGLRMLMSVRRRGTDEVTNFYLLHRTLSSLHDCSCLSLSPIIALIIEVNSLVGVVQWKAAETETHQVVLAQAFGI